MTRPAPGWCRRTRCWRFPRRPSAKAAPAPCWCRCARPKEPANEMAVPGRGHPGRDRRHQRPESSDGFTRLLPSVVTTLGYVVSFYFLSLTLREVPVGIAYAIWSGVGIVLISIVSALLFKQHLDAPAMIGMGLIIAGVVVMNVFSKSVSQSPTAASPSLFAAGGAPRHAGAGNRPAPAWRGRAAGQQRHHDDGQEGHRRAEHAGGDGLNAPPQRDRLAARDAQHPFAQPGLGVCHVGERDQQPRRHAQRRPPLVRSPPEHAHDQCREERRGGEGEGGGHHEQDVGRLARRDPRRTPPPSRILRGDAITRRAAGMRGDTTRYHISCDSEFDRVSSRPSAVDSAAASRRRPPARKSHRAARRSPAWPAPPHPPPC